MVCVIAARVQYVLIQTLLINFHNIQLLRQSLEKCYIKFIISRTRQTVVSIV